MLFALLEAMLEDNDNLSAKIKDKNDDNCTLTANVTAPSQKPMVIEIKLVERADEENKEEEEDEK